MSKRVIIAGGGTGGHIFPAIAIAHALLKKDKNTEILFVGAKGKMEMEKVPQAGFPVKGLDIAGFNRSSLIKNISLPWKLVKSFFQVRKIVNDFKPDAVIGVGGYSSFPVLRYAQTRKIPTFIHESNSFAGRANIMLGKNATKVFTASEGMEKFFPAAKIVVTGNPVRANIAAMTTSREDGLASFGLNTGKQTLLVIGGSLGAKAINEAIDAGLDQLLEAGLQLIWQTGKPYAAKAAERCREKTGVWTSEFIGKMENAYASADIVVARSGAMTVAELSVAGKPVIFVPFPYAAEDHQTVNAMQLVNKHAAMMVKDADAAQQLVATVIALANDAERRRQFIHAISAFAVTNADTVIADEIIKSIG